MQVLFDLMEVKSEEISVNLTFGGRKGLESILLLQKVVVGQD